MIIKINDYVFNPYSVVAYQEGMLLDKTFIYFKNGNTLCLKTDELPKCISLTKIGNLFIRAFEIQLISPINDMGYYVINMSGGHHFDINDSDYPREGLIRLYEEVCDDDFDWDDEDY